MAFSAYGFLTSGFTLAYFHLPNDLDDNEGGS